MAMLMLMTSIDVRSDALAEQCRRHATVGTPLVGDMSGETVIEYALSDRSGNEVFCRKFGFVIAGQLIQNRLRPYTWRRVDHQLYFCLLKEREAIASMTLGIPGSQPLLQLTPQFFALFYKAIKLLVRYEPTSSVVEARDESILELLDGDSCSVSYPLPGASSWLLIVL
ncbi:hypothetical protein SPRG_12533 [Saprolegnia parasitica CBS 223.65]|uniref:Uncharacterized protein n=1 Tax=Saprolegnia parasitica (strain CBS 223.65) TaxID=695850 RepID=A0A067BT95_SAPPC|nr:hypothetical protein SPRG_12533 [Saprolegnia parasitica CBS 223.65]KDO21488.1 hypothetical protein SPRG_12533 [Saprolegnia parasitica CBS 223.65]|eukprot:XP_012207832.1 hypothetical protein SPRG_12533 [Saprolegnia parasitica CBS 223.65]